MTVYLEDAFLLNFILDGCLVFLALHTAKAEISWTRVLLSATLGGGEAILFPLFPTNGVPFFVCKAVGGLLLPLVAVKGTGKKMARTMASFFALSFAFAGALFAFSDGQSLEGGYLVSELPIPLILLVFASLSIAVYRGVKRWYRLRPVLKNTLFCKLVSEKEITVSALYDSGNHLFYRGEPVSVVSPKTALSLGNLKTVGKIQIKTLVGEKSCPIFRLPRIEYTINDKKYEKKNVLFAVTATGTEEYAVILHTSFLEANHENSRTDTQMVEA